MLKRPAILRGAKTASLYSTKRYTYKGYPFERIAIDFKGPLPTCTRNMCLLVIVDEFSRFPFCYPCPNMYSETVIKCSNGLFTLCSVPSCVHSDNVVLLSPFIGFNCYSLINLLLRSLFKCQFYEHFSMACNFTTNEYTENLRNISTRLQS